MTFGIHRKLGTFLKSWVRVAWLQLYLNFVIISRKYEEQQENFRKYRIWLVIRNNASIQILHIHEIKIFIGLSEIMPGYY